MALAYPKESFTKLGEIIGRDAFLAALNDKEIVLKIMEKEVQDLDSAFKYAVRFEAYEKVLDSQQLRDASKSRALRTVHDDVYNRRVDVAPSTSSSDEPNRSPADTGGLVDELRRQIRELKREKDDLSKELGRRRLLDEQRNAPVTRSTADASRPSVQQRPMPTAGNQRGPIECYNCHEFGHISRLCQAPRVPRQVRISEANPAGPTNVHPGVANETTLVTNAHTSIDKVVGGRAVYLKATMNGLTLNCLLDSGSDVSIIPWLLVKEVKLEPTEHTLRAANGTDMRVYGATTVIVLVNGHPLEIEGLVSDNVGDIIIGVSWLSSHEAVWDFSAGQICIDGETYNLQSKSSDNWCRRIVLHDACVLPPQSEYLMSGDVQLRRVSDGVSKNTTSWMVDATELRPGLMVARSILPERLNDVPVRVANLSPEPVQLRAGSVIANLQNVDVHCETGMDEVEAPNDLIELIDGMVDSTHESVQTTDRQTLRDLLMEFSDVISLGEYDLGRTTKIRHSIDTGDTRPIRQALRRHPAGTVKTDRKSAEGKGERKNAEDRGERKKAEGRDERKSAEDKGERKNAEGRVERKSAGDRDEWKNAEDRSKKNRK